ncbi:hypothetical protein DLJ49_17645 [Rhodovulum sp. 12E13]|uniref:hypothetical protein n=1 Tax=Rhodovulum sp. 12E13 TaxID=2203891 RepID=UPI000E127804|nr:hypothetical protein [Rhodovulum sp. 12E13]RDC69895.1 hypothetical protein DLJ49_17645 [Rhodovulum sp. 12E13]
MAPCLTFLVPIRHPDNMASVPMAMRYLSTTLRSFANQSSQDWRAVIAANRGTPLPDLPDRTEVAWLDMPANRVHDMAEHGYQTAIEAFEPDKSRRLLAALEQAPDSPYVMAVDDDDLLHRDLVRFVVERQGENGWYVQSGWQFEQAGPVEIIAPLDDFHLKSGSSLVHRRDLLGLDGANEATQLERIRTEFVQHHFVRDLRAKSDAPLAPFTFRAAPIAAATPIRTAGPVRSRRCCDGRW